MYVFFVSIHTDGILTFPLAHGCISNTTALLKVSRQTESPSSMCWQLFRAAASVKILQNVGVSVVRYVLSIKKCSRNGSKKSSRKGGRKSSRKEVEKIMCMKTKVNCLSSE